VRQGRELRSVAVSKDAVPVRHTVPPPADPEELPVSSFSHPRLTLLTEPSDVPAYSADVYATDHAVTGQPADVFAAAAYAPRAHDPRAYDREAFDSEGFHTDGFETGAFDSSPYPAQQWSDPAGEGDESWRLDALCAETDPEAFFPEKGGSTREAKRVCGGCAVRDECLEYALGNDERFGIWGGLSERERRRIRLQRRVPLSA
jgi:WhiB family transcriptional regulator, redox-sensing transcriptional regulator